ncbi:helix-turn-helix transcriptional regulator [Streptomyces sp. NPDC051576]|uniref:response regulator transcription factor n=1 Tax=Streptomyces sp. NPDC051576 TaxID=3155803 RepID=UPI00342F3967
MVERAQIAGEARDDAEEHQTQHHDRQHVLVGDRVVVAHWQGEQRDPGQDSARHGPPLPTVPYGDEGQGQQNQGPAGAGQCRPVGDERARAVQERESDGHAGAQLRGEPRWAPGDRPEDGGRSGEEHQDRRPDRPSGGGREAEVVRLVALGRTNAEIAAELYVSLSTVKTQLSNVQLGLAARNRVEIAAWAWQHGQVRPGP